MVNEVSKKLTEIFLIYSIIIVIEKTTDYFLIVQCFIANPSVSTTLILASAKNILEYVHFYSFSITKT